MNSQPASPSTLYSCNLSDQTLNPQLLFFVIQLQTLKSVEGCRRAASSHATFLFSECPGRRIS
jgi:hypothetical protein